MPETERREWKFVEQTQPDMKAGIAAEYIAYYLDRIDVSLERIANTLEGMSTTATWSKVALEDLVKVTAKNR